MLAENIVKICPSSFCAKQKTFHPLADISSWALPDAFHVGASIGLRQHFSLVQISQMSLSSSPIAPRTKEQEAIYLHRHGDMICNNVWNVGDTSSPKLQLPECILLRYLDVRFLWLKIPITAIFAWLRHYLLCSTLSNIIASDIRRRTCTWIW